MANNKTLNELIDVFRDMSDRHLQINDFGFGTTDQIGESRKMNYPYLWTTVVNNSTLVLPENGGGFAYFDFNIILIVADRVNKIINTTDSLGEESDNGLEVSSDCLQIINDICAEISTHPYYHDNNITLVDQIILNPTWDEDDGIVNAWTAELTLRMPFRITYCGAPLLDKSTTLLNPTSCLGVTITDSDGSTVSSVDSGGTFACTLQVYDIELQFNFDSGDDVTDIITATTFTAGVYTSISDDGASGDITLSIDGGSYVAFSTLNPLTIISGSTIQVKRTITTSVGYAQINGTY